jgi:hypothetical protein
VIAVADPVVPQHVVLERKFQEDPHWRDPLLQINTRVWLTELALPIQCRIASSTEGTSA